MHIFNMSVTYLQSIGNVQLELWEEMMSQSMHYQTLLLNMCSVRKMTIFKTL